MIIYYTMTINYINQNTTDASTYCNLEHSVETVMIIVMIFALKYDNLLQHDYICNQNTIGVSTYCNPEHSAQTVMLMARCLFGQCLFCPPVHLWFHVPNMSHSTVECAGFVFG